MNRGLIVYYTDSALLMVALALGYLVCVAANKEKHLMKKLGIFIGVLIIAGSATLIALKVTKKLQRMCGNFQPAGEGRMIFPDRAMPVPGR